MSSALPLAARLAAGAALLALMQTAACRNPEPQPVPSDAKPLVIASIYPMAYIVDRIGGDDIELVSITPPGAEAHTFEPSPRDILALGDADLVVMNGLGLEEWLERAIRALGDEGPGSVVVAAEAVASHSDDPHVWLDPVLAARQAEQVRDALAEIDPARAEAYQTRAAALAADLAALDMDFAAALEHCERREFVISHAAFGHMAARYGLTQVSIAGVSPEAEPTAGELADVADAIVAAQIRHLLVEPSLSPRLAETLAAETGAVFLQAHQLESVTLDELAQHGDYLGLMRDNLASLEQALDCAQGAGR